jgi:hypothetical protein
MNPRHYVDFAIADPGDPSPRIQGAGAGLPAPLVAGAVLKVLHGAFGARPGRFALALPHYRTAAFAALRVFAGGRDDLDALVETVEGHPAIRDYSRIGYPRTVPAHYDGDWIEFRRYRIPSRKACRKPDDTLRERRMRRADEGRFPFFIMQSRGTGQQFGLYVEIRPAGATGDCAPDSYGLSVATRPFALPDLP